MPQFTQKGKDKVIFVTKEDHEVPSTVKLPESETRPGLLLPNGQINWNCPCLGGMVIGPCGLEFRKAFSCFYNSETQPKGSDCINFMQSMYSCMEKFPNIYKDFDKDDTFETVTSEVDNEGKKDPVAGVFRHTSDDTRGERKRTEPADPVGKVQPKEMLA